MGYSVHLRWVSVPIGSCGERECGWSTDCDLSEVEVDRLVRKHHAWHLTEDMAADEAIELGWNRIGTFPDSTWPRPSTLPPEDREILFARVLDESKPRIFDDTTIVMRGKVRHVTINPEGFSIGEQRQTFLSAEMLDRELVPVNELEHPPPEAVGDYWRYA